MANHDASPPRSRTHLAAVWRQHDDVTAPHRGQQKVLARQEGDGWVGGWGVKGNEGEGRAHADIIMVEICTREAGRTLQACAAAHSETTLACVAAAAAPSGTTPSPFPTALPPSKTHARTQLPAPPPKKHAAPPQTRSPPCPQHARTSAVLSQKVPLMASQSCPMMTKCRRSYRLGATLALYSAKKRARVGPSAARSPIMNLRSMCAKYSSERRICGWGVIIMCNCNCFVVSHGVPGGRHIVALRLMLAKHSPERRIWDRTKMRRSMHRGKEGGPAAQRVFGPGWGQGQQAYLW